MRRWTVGRTDLIPNSQGNGGSDVREELPEYSKAKDLICLSPSLIGDSCLGRTLSYLQAQTRRLPALVHTTVDILQDFYEVFEPSLLLVVKKAFGLRSDIAALNEDRPVPVVSEFRGNFFDAAISMWAVLPVWKKPIMSAALRELFVIESPDGLQVVLGMIRSSSRQCNAGKVDVYTRILQRIWENEKRGVARRIATPTSSPVHAPSKSPSPATGESDVSAARVQIFDGALSFVDDIKDKALNTVFNQPTKMYYAASDLPELALNVDVHGSSVYIAILMSTLGVRCPRQPFLLDTLPISCVSFLDALDREQLRQLWLPENLGKPYEAVLKGEAPRVTCQVNNHMSSFIFNGRQPWQIANNAVDKDCLKERREKLSPYLEQFASYFSKEIIVPRLTNYLLEKDEFRLALQVLLEHMLHAESSQTRPSLGSGSSNGDGDAADVRFWLWNLDVLPAELRVGRAVRLLQYAGLLKPDTESV
eukprot:TRINITY_DN16096_c0_g1_i1.p1 TRINITY_DN16096_c0_g1~~TRINITY_DN16096_c0_g1_i1.p1  ORF type:complete len:477 (+),score=82.14 TRINITY_DN16096_c0_g1_i1:436-1866(+)